MWDKILSLIPFLDKALGLFQTVIGWFTKSTSEKIKEDQSNTQSRLEEMARDATSRGKNDKKKTNTHSPNDLLDRR